MISYYDCLYNIYLCLRRPGGLVVATRWNGMAHSPHLPRRESSRSNGALRLVETLKKKQHLRFVQISDVHRIRGGQVLLWWRRRWSRSRSCSRRSRRSQSVYVEDFLCEEFIENIIHKSQIGWSVGGCR